MRAETQLEKDLALPVVGMEHAPNLIATLRAYGIEAEKAPADIEDRIRAQDEDLALVIDEDFAEVLFVCNDQPNEIKRVATLDYPPAEAGDHWTDLPDEDVAELFRRSEPA